MGAYDLVFQLEAVKPRKALLTVRTSELSNERSEGEYFCASLRSSLARTSIIDRRFACSLKHQNREDTNTLPSQEP